MITITLVALLVLILVALASLTRVETQVAFNSQQLSQARQNALMALSLSLGELQKYAGPDQRTTARADLDAALASNASAHGHWLGVYGSRVAADYSDTPDEIADKIAAAYAAAGSDPLARKGSQAILLNWLVSGNEGTGPAGGARSSAGDGAGHPGRAAGEGPGRSGNPNPHVRMTNIPCRIVSAPPLSQGETVRVAAAVTRLGPCLRPAPSPALLLPFCPQFESHPSHSVELAPGIVTASFVASIHGRRCRVIYRFGLLQVIRFFTLRLISRCILISS